MSDEQRIEEALQRLRNKRRLGSFYLDDVNLLADALSQLRERERRRHLDFLAASERAAWADQVVQAARMVVADGIDANRLAVARLADALDGLAARAPADEATDD